MKCIEQYSVKAGGKASDSKLCESNFSIEGTCYDYRMREDEEFKVCTNSSDCLVDILDGDGEVVGEGTNYCSTKGPHELHCFPSAQSKQWKNYVKAFREVRDSLHKNKIHQSILAEDNYITSFSPILRKANLDLYFYDMDDCVTDTLSILMGSGFIKVSFALIAVLFTIID